MKLNEFFNGLRSRGGGAARRLPRKRRRYRLTLVNELSLSRLWSFRFSRRRAVLMCVLAFVAAMLLSAAIFTFTPLGYILPGSLLPAERRQYATLALRVDSLARLAAARDAYTANLRAILSDSIVPDPALSNLPAASDDSLMAATEAERDFVRSFEQEDRYNLSVLSPIAAEGMIFSAPSAAPDVPGPVSAVYRGTVVSCVTAADGSSTVTIQHPNDFISSYNSLIAVYVDNGQKVSAGQRLGQTSGRPLLFELWHAGTRLDPAAYIAY